MDRPDSPAPLGASPIKAFLIILALIILTTVIFLMAANGEESPSTAETQSNPPPDFSLTDEEAIARFEELYQLSLSVYEERDLSLLPFVYLSGSSIYSDVQKEVTGLKEDGVVADMNAQTESVNVESNQATEIRVLQVVTLRIRFVDEKSKDVTLSGGSETQTIEWLLKPDQSNWLIYSATIVDAKPLKDMDQ